MIPEKIKKSIGNLGENLGEKYKSCKLSGPQDLKWSGREDLNLRLLAPHASALAGLRHAPNNEMNYILFSSF